MDEKTAERLYAAYFMRVYSFALSLTSNKSAAEEIAQETFFRALRTESSYRGDSEELTWLCAIAKNVYFDEVKKKKPSAQIPPDTDSGVDIEEIVESEDETMRIHRALHTLGEPYREVFELRVFGELPFEKIASIFGKTESWARVTYHRAVQKIKERIR